MRNLPANSTESIYVQHIEFEPPISNHESRTQAVDLKLDEPNKITIKMERKGTSLLGVEDAGKPEKEDK